MTAQRGDSARGHFERPLTCNEHGTTGCSLCFARHNHVTRDVKPRGVCPACDRILDKAAETLPAPCALCGGNDHREWAH